MSDDIYTSAIRITSGAKFLHKPGDSILLGLTQEEKTYGWILSYVRAAVSDLLQVPFDEVVEVIRASINFEEMVT